MINKTNSSAEMAYLAIKQLILSGKIEQGDPIIESEIADRLSISRTPIREALKKLNAEGYVDTIPNRGCFVKKITARDVLDVMQIREALEGMAARLACERISNKELDEVSSHFPAFDKRLEESDYMKAYQAGSILHEFLILNSGNLLLKEQLELLQERISRAVQISTLVPGRYINAHREHKEILDALYEKDPDMAEKKMRYHIEQVRNALLLVLI